MSLKKSLHNHSLKFNEPSPSVLNPEMQWLRDQLLEGAASEPGHTDWVDFVKELPVDRLVSWSRDACMRVWNLKSGESIHAMKTDHGRLKGIRLLSSNRVITWTTNAMQLWNPETGTLISDFDDLVLLPSLDGALITTDHHVILPCTDNSIRVLDLESGSFVSEVLGHVSPVQGMVALVDGSLVSWGGSDLRFWEGKSVLANRLVSAPSNHLNDLVEETLRVHGDIHVSRFRDGTLRVWDASSGVMQPALDAQSVGMEMLPDARCLSFSNDGAIRIWDLTEGTCDVVLSGHQERVEQTRLLPGNRLISWSIDSEMNAADADRLGGRNRRRIMCVWDLGTGSLISTLRGHENRIFGVRPLDDNRLLSWAKDGSIRIWDILHGTCLASTEGSSSGIDEDVEVVRDGRILFFFRQDDFSVRLWSGSAKEAPLVLRGHEQDGVWGAKLLDSGRILSISTDELGLWNGTTGALIRIMKHPGVGDVVQISRKNLLSWSFDGTLRVWNASTGVCTKVLREHGPGWIKVAKLSRDVLLTASADETIRIWSVREFVPLGTIYHPGPIERYSGTNDGCVVTWSQDGTIRKWDSEGRCIATLPPTWIEEPLNRSSSELVKFAGNSTRSGRWQASSMGNHVSMTDSRIDCRLSWHGEGAMQLISLSGNGLMAVQAKDRLQFIRPYMGHSTPPHGRN